MANTLIHHFLENSAARFPDKVALIHEQTRATYRQVNTDADRLASFLVGRGVEKGDRVVILLENSFEYVVAYYGILKAGAVAVPLSTDIKPDGLNPLLAELEPSAIISSSRFERLLQASDLDVPKSAYTLIIQKPKLNWDNHRISTFSFQQTTKQHPQPTNQTHKPPSLSDRLGQHHLHLRLNRQTQRSHAVAWQHCRQHLLRFATIRNLGRQDIHMVVLPFFYVMGKSLLNTHVAVGGTLVINNRFAYPAAVLKQMADEKVTGFSGVPSTYAYLLHRSPFRNSRGQFKHLRMVTQAGGHMARSVKTALHEALPDHTQICIMYGATEASARLTC